MVGIEVVEQDQIEIGRGRHLPAAKPAHRNDRGPLSADTTVLGREPIGDQAMNRVDNTFGDVRERDAGLLRGDRTGKDSSTDQEQALLAEQP